MMSLRIGVVSLAFCLQAMHKRNPVIIKRLAKLFFIIKN